MSDTLSTYEVVTLNPVRPETVVGTVQAMYFTEDGEFLWFKGAKHEVLLALRSEFVIKVDRITPDGA